MNFHSPTGGRVSSKQMLNQITSFVQSDRDGLYSLVIGTDSQVRQKQSGKSCSYVTAIVIHKKNFGAKYYWKRLSKNKPHSLRNKIYTETMISLEIAQKIVPDLRKTLNGANYELQIHIDVGQNGPTREMIKEVVGMVNGNGYAAKTKPQSWGASTVADKHT